MYGVGNHRNELVMKGFSREEAYAYVETDGEPGEFLIRFHEGEWYRLSDGNLYIIK